MKFRITEYVNGKGERHWVLQRCTWVPFAEKYIALHGSTDCSPYYGKHETRDRAMEAIDNYIDRLVANRVTRVQVEYVIR